MCFLSFAVIALPFLAFKLSAKTKAKAKTEQSLLFSLIFVECNEMDFMKIVGECEIKTSDLMKLWHFSRIEFTLFNGLHITESNSIALHSNAKQTRDFWIFKKIFVKQSVCLCFCVYVACGN